MKALTNALLYSAVLCTAVGHATDGGGLTKRLKHLVDLPSGTAHAAGVAKVQTWVAGELKRLGFRNELGKDRLLIGTRPGRGPGVITFVTHADTVFEAPSGGRRFTVAADGYTATGPGVIDDKGGIVVALEGLKRYLAVQKTPSATLKFVVSPSEEAGSPGLDEAFAQLSRESTLVLGFEPALEDGSIVVSRRGNRWYHVLVKGKEAHSGRAHRDGVNACHELSLKIAELSALTDYAQDVTVSVGTMRGGQDKYNIVCGEAEAKIDTRFAKPEAGEALHASITRILAEASVKGATTTFEIADDSPALSVVAEAKPSVDAYLAAITRAEGKPALAGSSGGSADVNHFARPGLTIIDGLGPVGGKMHTPEEFIDLRTLETRAEALKSFLLGL